MGLVCIPPEAVPGDAVVKNPPANAGGTRDVSLIAGLGRSPGVGNGNPLQYSCLENSMDRGSWLAIVPGITELGTTEHSEADRATRFLITVIFLGDDPKEHPGGNEAG